jgi:RNA polymerase primary sigma factor
LLAWQEPVSLQSPVNEEIELGELIPDRGAPSPAEVVSEQLLRADVASCLSALSPRERRVVGLRFGLKDGRVRTLGEIGSALGVTRERARQIEGRALRTLRTSTLSVQMRDH